MDVKQIKSFIDAMASSDLAELEASKDGWTLRLVRHAAGTTARGAASGSARRSSAQTPPPGQAAATAADNANTEVRAPLYGILYLSPSPDAPPFVTAGQAVKAGDTLCVIEAMKVFNNIRAERDGVVDIVVATSGSEVETGQLLMRMA